VSRCLRFESEIAHLEVLIIYWNSRSLAWRQQVASCVHRGTSIITGSLVVRVGRWHFYNAEEVDIVGLVLVLFIDDIVELL